MAFSLAGYRRRDDIYQHVSRQDRPREKISFQMEDRIEMEEETGGGSEERYSTFTSTSIGSKRKKMELIVNCNVRRGSRGDQSSESDDEREDGEVEEEESSITMATEALRSQKEGGSEEDDSHVVPKINVVDVDPSAPPR